MLLLNYYGFSQSDIGVTKIISPVAPAMSMIPPLSLYKFSNYGLASMDTLPFEVKY
jgi:hypothetical protein